ELQEAAARQARRPLGREAGELAVDEVLELGGLGGLVEAAPVLRPLLLPQLLPPLFEVEPGLGRLGSGLGAALAFGVDAVHQIRSLSLLVRRLKRPALAVARRAARQRMKVVV